MAPPIKGHKKTYIRRVECHKCDTPIFPNFNIGQFGLIGSLVVFFGWNSGISNQKLAPPVAMTGIMIPLEKRF